MIAVPPRKVGVMKCCVCRLHRQKCIWGDPQTTERTWIEGGQQDKCARCAKLGHACGPSEYASRNEENEPRSPSIVPGKRRASEMAQPKVQSKNITPTRNMLGMAGLSRALEEDGIALESRLKEIDLRQEALSRLDNDILSIDVIDGDYEGRSRFDTLYETREAIFHRVLGMLHLTKELAVRVEEAGASSQAYIAYTRVLEVYRALNMSACYEMRITLIRMANLLWTVGDEYRAQMLAWQALESRDHLRQAQQSDLDLLKDIAKSLLKTFPQVSQLIQSEMVYQEVCVCKSLLPPLHAMIESNYASQVPGNVLQSGFHPAVSDDPPTESPIVGGLKAVQELLGGFTDAHLEERDFNRQSLLHLVALRCKEGLGQAIMLRAKHDPRLLHRLVNARNKLGQTVLTVAIANGCSLTFITALLNNGAEHEPSTMPLAMTPLQEACFVGSLEVVKLLVTRGAKTDTAHPGTRMPRVIAQERGHPHILKSLGDPSAGSPESPSARDDDDRG